MGRPAGLPLVGRILFASALVCGATGVLFLQDYTVLGSILCLVALADFGLVWLLWWWSLAACGRDPRPVRR